MLWLERCEDLTALGPEFDPHFGWDAAYNRPAQQFASVFRFRINLPQTGVSN
jgi:hypothetical protein